jgi:hypothetical protein
MKLRIAVVVLVILLVAVAAFAPCACESESEQPADVTAAASTGTTAAAPTGTTVASAGPAASSSMTASTEAHEPAERKTLEIGDVAKVEQGYLSVSKITVTDDLASDEADALLITGEEGEGANVSKAPADGNEFLMITFMYKKAEWYEFRGGLYPEDLILKNADGDEHLPVETEGHGGLYDTNAADVKPDVEAFTTAVFEVPKGEKGLVLTYHPESPDGFFVNIR